MSITLDPSWQLWTARERTVGCGTSSIGPVAGAPHYKKGMKAEFTVK